MENTAWIPAGLHHWFLMFSFDMSAAMNVTHDWIIVFKTAATWCETRQDCSFWLGGFRSPLKASTFFFLILPAFLSSPICLSICHSDVSSFHEHNPPRPELTQLSSARGKNLFPAHLSVCVSVICHLLGLFRYKTKESFVSSSCNKLNLLKNTLHTGNLQQKHPAYPAQTEDSIVRVTWKLHLWIVELTFEVSH